MKTDIKQMMRMMAEPGCEMQLARSRWLLRGAEHIEQLEQKLERAYKSADRRVIAALETAERMQK